MFKNKLNNYIISEILKSYALVLISFSLLIWIAQAAKNLNLITESGLSIKTYCYFILLIFPKILSQLMIISFLIGTFLTIIRLLDTKEIEIYWLAGISKLNIAFTIIKISFFPTVLALFFYVYLVPHANFKSREILANSEFSMTNSLVKKNNFNSPLKKLTIFVNKNDNKGNLEKVYIFEELKTIIAKKGRVVNINDNNYLELIDGFIHEKNQQQNITVVKFEKTIFDFTKYQTEITKNTKLQEQRTSWLINEYRNNKKNFKKNKKKYNNLKKTNQNILEEIHKRIVKPLFIPFVAFLCCFLLYTNNEKINLTRLKIFIFSLSTLLIIFIEILVGISSKNYALQTFFYILPLIGTTLTFYLLKNFLKKEPIYR